MVARPLNCLLIWTALLKSLFDSIVDRLDLAIALRMIQCREGLQDTKIIAKVLEFNAIKLCPMVGNNIVRDFECTDNVFLDKIDDFLVSDFR